jgi:hypothetical protein
MIQFFFGGEWIFATNELGLAYSGQQKDTFLARFPKVSHLWGEAGQ